MGCGCFGSSDCCSNQYYRLKALAVFHGHGDHALSGLLKRGYRHVFAAVQAGDYWVSIDGRMGVPVIEVVAPGDFDLAQFYREEGFTVIETRQQDVPPRSPFAIANCVGMVKAVLCIQSPAVTPWQLFKYLRKNA